ncbi:hypothetical protein C2G38_2230855 [Gigaspora rosea]|uniref:Uncharacterized protein n=1 Tax=Gigaspora rosea TaxID=44941 RepID=A0A397U2Y9_9GLOM|nr:hypothetical protein C2G38_2230855 [Gigaspora rosea]
MSTDRGKPVIRTDGKLLMINVNDFINIHECRRSNTSTYAILQNISTKVNARDKIRMSVFRIKIRNNIRELVF